MSEFPVQGGRPLWIASYPRSGNTFLRIILENIFHLPSFSMYYIEGENHPDPSAETLEQAPLLPRDWRDFLMDAAELPVVPIKTHDLPSDQAPAIFVARDGRAAIHSYFHYHKKFAFEQPSLTEVIAGACQFGSWSDHYWGWRPKTRPNTLVLGYEELVAHPHEVIPRLAEFLNIAPRHGGLPRFEELQRRAPAFFRRGQNTDYLTEWTPGQMALFNHLHAPAMEDLGFPFAPSAESPVSTVSELARSAARLHRLYLEQLTSLGRAAGEHRQEVQGLSHQIRELSRQIDHMLDPMVKTKWVRLGLAVGALQPRAHDEHPGSPPETAAKKRPPPARRLKSSDENTRSSSPGLEPDSPSAPNVDVSAPG